MKLLNFESAGSVHFGLATESHAVSFLHLQSGDAEKESSVGSITSYLENLPDSYDIARNLERKARAMLARKETDGFIPLDGATIRPILERPTALMDFGLTPRHLANAAKTMMRYEFGPVLGPVLSRMISRRLGKMSASATPPYYKGNHLAVIGDQDEIGWPRYTSYLDIEPELAVVIGNSGHKIAGYTIFNDASARDVQFPEMIGTGPGRSKDFACSNGLGPYLVTPDEISDPLSLRVEVDVGGRFRWHGHTSEHTLRPQAIVEYLETVFRLQPGTVLGMGTIPDCTGLDNDRWLLPGDLVKITFEKLGTLRQKVPSRLPDLEPSRWSRRVELQGYQHQWEDDGRFTG